MEKALTYHGLIDYAQKNYNNGGDYFVECWDERDFHEYTELFGPITKSKALSLFRLQKSRQDDIESTVW